MENSEEVSFNEVRHIIDKNNYIDISEGRKAVIIDSLVDETKPFIPKFYIIEALSGNASLPAFKNHDPNVIEDEYLKVFGKNIFNTIKNDDPKTFSRGLSTFDKFMKYYKRKANREKLYLKRKKLGRRM